jgi:DNA mismatch repair ATPase MutS
MGGGDGHVWVITGPNASGKSTLLRLAGVAALLGQMGTAVPAKAMRFTPMRVMSDLRARDDLARGESYYLAEVRHLVRLIGDGGGEPAPVLGVIDEPFRGTNSREKQAAGMALIRWLLERRGLYLVATHDVALAKLAADHDAGASWHFEAEYVDGAIRFDYRLRPGTSTIAMALRILEKEGYPAALLSSAQRFLAELRDEGGASAG